MKKYYRIISTDTQPESSWRSSLEYIKRQWPTFSIGTVFWEDVKEEDHILLPFHNKFFVNIPRRIVEEISRENYFELQSNPEEDPTFREDLEDFIKSKYKVGNKLKSLVEEDSIFTIKNFIGFPESYPYSYTVSDEETDGNRFIFDENQFAEIVEKAKEETNLKVGDKLYIGTVKVNIEKGVLGYYIFPIDPIQDFLSDGDRKWRYKFYEKVLGYEMDQSKYSPEVKTLSDLEKVIKDLREEWDRKAAKEIEESVEREVFLSDTEEEEELKPENPYIKRYSEEMLEDYLKKGYKVRIHPSSEFYERQSDWLGVGEFIEMSDVNPSWYRIRNIKSDYQNAYQLKDLDFFEIDKYILSKELSPLRKKETRRVSFIKGSIPTTDLTKSDRKIKYKRTKKELLF